MASTYSTLKIELIGTGEQAGLWGTTTNTNLGTAIEEAIVGSADVSFSSADVTLTLTDVNTTQAARHVRLNLTGTSGGARNLILGSGCQIDKPYLINNGLADTVTVKNTAGTGIAVPAGKTMWVYNNGTNVVDAVTHLTSLTLGSALPIASGGTGSTSTTFVNLATNVTGDLPFANLTQGSALSVLGVTGNATADVASIAAATDNQVLRRSGTTVAFGAVNLASSDAVTGALTVTNGGTGGTSQSTARTGLGATTLGGNLFTITNPSAITFPRFNADNTVSSLSAPDFRTAIGAGTGGGTVTSVGGTGTVNGITLTGTVTSSGNLTLGGTLSGVNLATQVTGDLPFANLAQGSALSVLGVTGNATADVASIAAGTDHQVLRRSGTSLAFGAVNLAQAAAITGTLPLANGGSGQTTAQAAMNAFAGAVTSGSYLRGNGSNVLMSTIQAGDVPTLNQNTTGSAATLTTARTFQTNLASTSTASFNGSANVTPGVTGTLPVANGGTGVTSSTGTGSVVLSASPTFTGTVTTAAIAMADNLLTRSVLQDYAVEGSAIGNTGSTRTLDLTVANFFSATLDQACTFTFSNPPASGDFGTFVLELTNGGAFAITWPASVDWPGGSAPTLTASGKDQLVFTTRDGGTIYFGFLAGKDIK